MEKNHICKKCGGIAGWDSYFQSWICTRCGNEEPKPSANADRLRAMSDEELAEWHKQMMEGYCPRPTSECPSDCYQCWLDWLRQEADNG